MVQTNALVIGWNRAIPGRETMAMELFTHSVSFYEKQKAAGKIESWEPVFLQVHGGDFNGFFLIRGTHAQLDTFMSMDEFVDITIKADLYLTGVGVNLAYSGTAIQEMMMRWMKSIPTQK